MILRVIVRAWNKEGYHKDIALLSERQVHLTESRVTQPTGSMLFDGPFGYSVVIDPKDFPEMERFQIIVPSEQ